MLSSILETAEETASSGASAWWRSLGPQLRLGILAVLLPGVLLHELTHAGVAMWWADDVRFYWDEIAVEMQWPAKISGGPIVAAHLAPLILGWIASWGLAIGYFALQPLDRVEVVLVAYVTFQVVFYTLPGLGDLLLLRQQLDV